MKKKRADGKSHVLGGFAAAAFGIAVGQPFDVIKTNMIANSAKNVTKNPYTVFKYVLKHDGIRGLYKGALPASLRVIPGGGMYYYIIHVFKRFFLKNVKKERLNESQNFFVGFSARAIGAVVFNPLFVIKTRFEYSLGQNKSVWFNIKELARKRQLLQGVTSSIMRDAPYSGLMFMFYARLCRGFSKATGLSISAVSFPASIIANVSALCITHPFDVIRTRMQLNSGVGVRKEIASIYRNDGISGFFRGFNMRAGKKVFVTSVSWSIYEIVIEKMMKKKNVY